MDEEHLAAALRQRVFKRSMPPDFIRGWIPVRVKTTRQNKNKNGERDRAHHVAQGGAGAVGRAGTGLALVAFARTFTLDKDDGGTALAPVKERFP